MSSEPIDYLWEKYTARDIADQYESDTLTFAVFDPSTPDMIEDAYQRLSTQFKLLAQNYPWGMTQPHVARYETSPMSRPYLFGYCVHDSNTAEQDFFVSLLWQLSKDFSQVFIRLYDMEWKDVLLVMFPEDDVPDWLDEPNALNRIWLHDGNVVFVNERERDTLVLKEVLPLLTQKSFITLNKVSRALNEDFIAARLKPSILNMHNVIDVEVAGLSNDLIRAFASFPFLRNKTLRHIMFRQTHFKGETDWLRQSSSFKKNSQRVIPMAVPSDFNYMVDFFKLEFEDSMANLSRPQLIGQLLERGLEQLALDDPTVGSLLNGHNLHVQGVDDNILSRGRLQETLLRLNLISAKSLPNTEPETQSKGTNEAKPDQTVPEQSHYDEPENFDRLKDFFLRSQSGFGGIDDQVSSDDDNDHTTGKDGQADSEDSFEIDDFLEHYAKFKMGLDDNDLAKFRTNAKKRSADDGHEQKAYHTDSDYQTDSSSDGDRQGFDLSDDDEFDIGDDEELAHMVRQFKESASSNPMSRQLLEHIINSDKA